jgi:phosphoadenosine phosphosulfate reductase
MQFVPTEDPLWSPLPQGADDAVPSPRAHAVLDLAQWRAACADWPPGLPVALALENTVDVSGLGALLERVGLVVLQFPKWTDGRAYSQARLLHSRVCYRGLLRAAGDVIVDMLPLLQRNGFDEVQLRAGQSETEARKALHYFAGHYQDDVARAPVSADPKRAARPRPALALAQRGRARLATRAHKTPGFEQRVAQALLLLRQAAQAHPGRIVQATSLGVEGMVITDLIARHGLPIDVATLDTGALHEETLALIPALEQRYGIRVERFAPRAQDVQRFVQQHGPLAMRRSVELRHACCALRKLEPMQRLLQGRDAWITGLRREQSEHRAQVPLHETDRDGRSKYYPLAPWSEDDVWHYVQLHDVPYNLLHDQGFPSIGCQPCTRAVAPGEDFRAGRWWWEQDGQRECGLHGRPQPLAA